MGRAGTIIIVGGGMAGLGAARPLVGRGLEVTLLEARQRLGGRILTFPRLWPPVELGAEFVHGQDPELWRWIESIPLHTREVSGQHWMWSRESGLGPYDFSKEIGILTSRINGTDRDQTVHEFLGRQGFTMQERRQVVDYVEGFHAAPVDRFGIRAFAAAEKDAAEIQAEKAYRLLDGFGALVRWKEHEVRRLGARIFCGVEVTRIHWYPGGVGVEGRVGGRAEQWHGRAAVVTLPLGVLKTGLVQFEPALPAKERAIAALGAGHVTRLVLRFRERFWPERFGFIHTFDEWLPTWWTNEDPLVLTGWAGGPKGERAAKADQESLLEHAFLLLARTFSKPAPSIRRQFVERLTHNWHDDPLARMAYSYVPVNQLEATRQLAEPVAGTLFFAGEATSCAQYGTVHGALNSGLRAAKEILGCLLPPSVARPVQKESRRPIKRRARIPD